MFLSVASLGAARSDVADAVMRGDTAAVRALLTQKADVNGTQGDGATALHWAVFREDLATTNLLIQAGATILPANPCFYTNPQTIEQLVDTVVARVLDHLGVPQRLMPRWQEERE